LSRAVSGPRGFWVETVALPDVAPAGINSKATPCEPLPRVGSDLSMLYSSVTSMSGSEMTRPPMILYRARGRVPGRPAVSSGSAYSG